MACRGKGCKKHKRGRQEEKKRCTLTPDGRPEDDTGWHMRWNGRREPWTRAPTVLRHAHYMDGRRLSMKLSRDGEGHDTLLSPGEDRKRPGGRPNILSQCIGRSNTRSYASNPPLWTCTFTVLGEPEPQECSDSSVGEGGLIPHTHPNLRGQDTC